MDLSINEINIRQQQIPNVEVWSIGLPPPIIPPVPRVTQQIGVPIIQMPGCVETHKDGQRNKNLAEDDPNGIVTHCDAGMPTYDAMDYTPEQLVITQSAPVEPVKTEQPPTETPPPPEVPSQKIPPVPKLENKSEEQVCQWYKELLASDPRCIEPTFTEKYLPPLDLVTTTASIAFVATSSAIFAKPIADLLLKVVKPTVKKIMKKITTLRKKKVVRESVKDRRDQQRIRSHAVRKLKGLE